MSRRACGLGGTGQHRDLSLSGLPKPLTGLTVTLCTMLAGCPPTTLQPPLHRLLHLPTYSPLEAHQASSSGSVRFFSARRPSLS